MDGIIRNIKVTKVFDKNFRASATVILNKGGARSSKSHSVCQLLIQKLFTEKNKNILVTRKTLPALRITAYKMFIDLLIEYGLYRRISHNKTMRTYDFNSNRVLFTSFDDPVKIQSTEFNYIWMEEAEEFTFEDFITLKTRLSGRVSAGEKNRIYLTYNPKSESSYINKKLRTAADSVLIHSTYHDNPFLPEEYKSVIESLKEQDSKMYMVFALGEYASIEGRIFTNIKEIISYPPSFKEVFYGLDFGYNSPSCLIEIGVSDDNYYITEKIYRSKLFTHELIRIMKELNISKTASVYADSASPDTINEIYNAGFNILPAHKNVKDAIDFINSLKLFTRNSNYNFNKELDEYVWKKDKNGNVLDEPVKYNDHAMDALRYALWSHLRRRYNLPERKYVTPPDYEPTIRWI